MKIHFNGLHITGYTHGNSEWQCPTWFWLFFFCGICQPYGHALTCTGCCSTGTPLDSCGSSPCGTGQRWCDVCPKRDDGTSSAVAFWTGHFRELDFLRTRRHSAPTKMWLWTRFEVFPSAPLFLLKSTKPLKEQPGDGRRREAAPFPYTKLC